MPKELDNPKLLALWLVVCCAFMNSLGCQRRAYTDLYAESMAGEIRELEDRIYEYDAAYQGIEEELAILQSENARLHDRLTAMNPSPNNASPSRSLFKNLPGANKAPNTSSESYNFRESYPAAPEAPIQVIPKPDPVPSIVPVVPPKASAPKTPSVDLLPSSNESKPAKSPKPAPELNDLVPPKIEMGSPTSNPASNPTNDSTSNPTLPPNTVPNPSIGIPATPGVETLPAPNNSFSPPPFNPLSAPPANNGTQHRADENRSVRVASSETPVPASKDLILKPMLAHATAVKALPGAIDDDVIDAGRIELPSSIQPAAFQASSPKKLNASPTDTKVIEIAFHPTLCRGQNLGADDSNDGMYLVLQPRNASGEAIDVPASLTIVVLDPLRPENESKLGRWTLTKEEVDAQLEPVGIGHGYHIPLRWQAAKPTGDVVQVYVRYEMEDGRRLVNERRLQLHVPSVGSASWTPRVAK